jgi:Regulator of chromosome condensation (RCC1) repeat
MTFVVAPRLRGNAACFLLVAGACACGGATSREAADRSGEPAGTDVPALPSTDPNCAVDLDGYGGRHCAVYQDGRVWCWGVGSLDDVTASAAPLRIDGVSGAVRVRVGPRHTCAETDEGLVCWGNNAASQIDESGVSPRDPTGPELGGGGPSARVSVGLGDLQTCVNDAFGHVYCRGADASGNLRGSTQIVRLGSAPNVLLTGEVPLALEAGVVYLIEDWLEPLPLPFYGTDNVLVRAGSPSCAIKRDGSLWCSAYSLVDAGELVRNQQLSEGARWVGSGDFFVCALTDSQRVWCEGWNPTGQLGRGTLNDSSQLLPGAWVVGLEEVRALSVARFSACALTADGTVTCWGAYGPEGGTATPTRVSGCAEQRVSPPGRGPDTEG